MLTGVSFHKMLYDLKVHWKAHKSFVWLNPLLLRCEFFIKLSMASKAIEGCIMA